MLFDKITLLEGADIANLTVNAGTAYPSNPNAGELFYRSDLLKLFLYNGSAWGEVGGGGEVSSSAITTALGYTPVDPADLPSTFVTTFGGRSGAVSLTAADINNALGYTPADPAAGGGGVTAFNTRTGSVTLTSSDVTSALTYTPANKAGDTLNNISFGTMYDEQCYSATYAASMTFNCTTSNIFKITMTGNITSMAFQNIPAAGRMYTLTMVLIQDAAGSRSVTWPANVRWQNGTAPSLTATGGKIDIVCLTTYDGGTTWLGMSAGSNF